MSRIRALLRDRRRAQQGSVLSGVLIMTAFLAIISGALMTALSGNFLLSRNLMNRATTEATINSAAELAFNQMETTALIQGCPTLSSVTLNGGTAAASYVSCWPTVDIRSPRYTSMASGSFNVDGTHSVIPASSQDLYVVGDSAGNVYSYPFGQTTPAWSMNLSAQITGPPMAMQDAACQGGGPCPDTGGPGGSNADIVFLVPIAGGGSSGCSAVACVKLLGQDVPSAPDISCYMQAAAAVTSRPAGGLAFPQLAYFGDSGGTLHANNATEFSCTQLASSPTPNNAGIVAGPIVFQNSGRDELYVVTSAKSGGAGQLLWYEYSGGSSLALRDMVTLPYPNPVGVTVEQNAFPARLVVTFAGGGVAVVTTQSNFDPHLLASSSVGGGFGGAPAWCACPGGPQIGVAAQNSVLYVLDANLNVLASYGGGSAIRTAPAADGVGEWFFGADDGYLHEVQLIPGQPALVHVAQFGGGGLGSVGSSVQVAGCPAGICAYLGTSNTAYLVSLDARDAVISVCISATPPTCSGVNPRLWATVEIGSQGSKQTVHVRSWSYNST